MADLRRNWPITVVWGKTSDGWKVPLIFDSELRVIEPFLGYLIYISSKKVKEKPSEQGYATTINKAALSLKKLAEFMRMKRLAWDELEDDSLEAFRDWCYDETRTDVRSVNDLSAKATTNEKLVCVYQFYGWAQEIEGLIEDRIGWPMYPIQSTYKPGLRNHRTQKDNRLYPLKFRRVGASSRSKQQYHATEEDLRNIRRYFWESPNSRKAVRDVLLLDVADATGLRAGSLSSLAVEDFSDKVIEEVRNSDKDHIWVQPVKQKFDYRKKYRVPFPVAVRVNRYCNGPRKELLNSLRRDETTARGYLFLSTRTGAPLSHEYISRIFGSALTRVGVLQRAGAHAVRRKFTDEMTAEHHAVRKANNLSTAPEDVLRPVADALGQNDISSQESYQRVVMSDIDASYEHQLKNRNLQLHSDIAAKDEEIARLHKLLRQRKMGSEFDT